MALLRASHCCARERPTSPAVAHAAAPPTTIERIHGIHAVAASLFKPTAIVMIQTINDALTAAPAGSSAPKFVRCLSTAQARAPKAAEIRAMTINATMRGTDSL